MLFYSVLRPIVRFALLLLTGVIWLVPENCLSKQVYQRRSMAKTPYEVNFRKVAHVGCTVLADQSDNIPKSPVPKREGISASTLQIDNGSWSYQICVLGRAVYLLFLFFPVMTTAWLAYISPHFRSLIWFPLLRYSIANSGAVSAFAFSKQVQLVLSPLSLSNQ